VHSVRFERILGVLLLWWEWVYLFGQDMREMGGVCTKNNLYWRGGLC
jgi:hypothetical protein